MTGLPLLRPTERVTWGRECGVFALRWAVTNHHGPASALLDHTHRCYTRPGNLERALLVSSATSENRFLSANGEFAGDLDRSAGMLNSTFAEDIDFRLHFLDDGVDAIWFNPADVALIAINEDFIGKRYEHGRPVDPSSDDVIGTDEERRREKSEEGAE